MRIGRFLNGILAIAMAIGVYGVSAPARAQQDYIGRIMLVGFGFCPRGTAEAAGQLLPVSTQSALFSLYGCTYGGDCRTTFALPDLRGRAPIGFGLGPGLTNHKLGGRGGTESVTLTISQMPSHSHNATTTAELKGSTQSATDTTPSSNAVLGTPPVGIYSTGDATTAFGSSSVSAETVIDNAGGGNSISIQNPYLALRYCVVLEGIYPSRN